MNCCRIFNQKCLLGFFNALFMLSGIVVMISGFYLFTDNKRILLSSLLIISPNENNPFYELPEPLFFYIAFILTIFGIVIVSVSFLGFWTSFIHNYCLLTIYFLMVLGLLLVEFAICLVIILWPQCLGLNLDTTEMVKRLQGYYGVPGHEQYTVAMDFAQTIFDCCAINTSINYDTSFWRLQKYGKKELSIPITCCELMNKYDSLSYLDPKPVNLTQCQSLDSQEFEKSRHLDGCLDKIEYWYREHYIVLLTAGLLIALIEFFVLISIVLSCTKIKQNRMRQVSPVKLINERANSRILPQDNSLQRRNSTTENIYQEDFISVTPETRDVYVQPANFFKHKYPPTKFKVNNYQISPTSYLV